MNIQLSPALIGGVSGAFVSGIIYWILDRRRESRSVKKYKRARKDTITFLHRIEDLRKTNDFDSYCKKIGNYRFTTITKALSAMNILSITHTQAGFVVNIQKGFSQFSQDDISNLIIDVNKGCYDSCFHDNM